MEVKSHVPSGREPSREDLTAEAVGSFFHMLAEAQRATIATLSEALRLREDECRALRREVQDLKERLIVEDMQRQRRERAVLTDREAKLTLEAIERGG